MTEPDKKKILAKIFCLKEDTAFDDDTRFNQFWGKVEDCEILDNDHEKFTESIFIASLTKCKLNLIIYIFIMSSYCLAKVNYK